DRDIAGVCDPTGLVFGLMPHPERFLHPTNHPHWTRQALEFMQETPVGLRYFQNAVEYVKAGGAVAASGD
ncbi:MAG: phosphoribosylformylglycinamidine synthase subunit PurQ, partial [Planctomycetota bacterium]